MKGPMLPEAQRLPPLMAEKRNPPPLPPLKMPMKKPMLKPD